MLKSELYTSQIFMFNLQIVNPITNKQNLNQSKWKKQTHKIQTLKLEEA
jgi:hypothetical protein